MRWGGRRPNVPRVRLASIDLGTNTVRLLVAEVTAGTAAWRTVHAEQRVTRLGEGLRASGTLGDAAAARTAAAVVAYVARARAAGAARVAVVATSAVREAANGRAFVTDLERAAGIAVRVISGEEEALPAEISALSEARVQARLAKDWRKSDELRDQLANRGWEVRDTKDGQKITRRAGV